MNELTDAKLQAEIDRCLYCEEKPCRDACPAHCSPADFIMAARVGADHDMGRSAAEILSQNPLGGICGAVCPDTHCMAACSRAGLDRPIDIPAVQHAVVSRAHRTGTVPTLELPAENGKKVAVIGSGPAGLAAAFTLSRQGYRVDVFERAGAPGGALNLIPAHRLPRETLDNDLRFLLSTDRITVHLDHEVTDPAALTGYDATLLAVGVTEPIWLKVPGEDAAISGWDYLSRPDDFPMPGPVLVIGGGAVAVDCAVTARLHGAERVVMVALEKWSEMPLTGKERDELREHEIEVAGRTRLVAIDKDGDAVAGVRLMRVAYPAGDRRLGSATAQRFDPRGVVDVAGTEHSLGDIGHVIVAIGHRPSLKPGEGRFVAGDCDGGASTVVEAAAAGKNAAAAIDAALRQVDYRPPARKLAPPAPGSDHAVSPRAKKKSTLRVPGWNPVPVPLDTDFFGRTIPSPFLLSAAPPTDGYEQMKRALDAGWAGGIMKTAFDDVPIHIPSEYMFAFNRETWANCDNVSGHSLNRVCREVERLVAEYPDRLIMASTGGPVTGNDAGDSEVWASNTRKLESAGIGGIEYSLSCPQGGDGTEGDIVSQNAALTVKIIDWILSAGDPAVPKLFKLTAAVTSVEAIVMAIRDLLARYPEAKAGVTLANTFPTLAFRAGTKPTWEEGVVVGMSGAGVTPISNLTLAKVSGLGVTVSGNGGPMDYKAAADFLALGARTVQFCTLAMKYGHAIIGEMHSGLSHLLAARGLSSVEELIGRALPEPITDFMALTATKKISACRPELCLHCGNCSRCSYLAIELDAKKLPVTDPERCVGCSICAKKCPSGALYMRERSAAELAALREA